MKSKFRKLIFFHLCAFLFILTSFAQAQTANFTPSSINGTTTDIFVFTDSSPGSLAAWTWEFGDGSIANRSVAAGHSSGHTVKHTYSSPGTYPVKLTVTDAAGSTGEKTISVTINFPTPTMPTGLSANFVHFRGSSAQEVMFGNTSSGPVSSWIWDFKDGEVDTTRNASHTYAAAGIYSVRMIVKDTSGHASSKTVQINVPVQPSSGLAKKPIKSPSDCFDPAAGYAGDLPKWRSNYLGGEWTVGLAAQVQALKYDFAKKKAGAFVGAGPGVSFRFYQDVDVPGVGVKPISQIRTECRMSTWKTKEETFLPKATPLFSVSPIIYVSQLTREQDLTVEPAIMFGFFDDIINVGTGFNLTGKDGDVGDVFLLLSLGAGFNW